MKNKNFLITIILLLLVTLGLYLLRRNQPAYYQEPITAEPQPALTENPSADEEFRTQPEQVVEAFLEYFIQSAPPISDETALNRAVSLLSEGAKMGFSENLSSSDLARLLGVQDLPDSGFTIGEITYQDNRASDIQNGLAKIPVELLYTGGNTTRIFLLSKIGNIWQIDAITQ